LFFHSDLLQGELRFVIARSGFCDEAISQEAFETLRGFAVLGMTTAIDFSSCSSRLRGKYLTLAKSNRPQKTGAVV
jgi:hypothetical protein